MKQLDTTGQSAESGGELAENSGKLAEKRTAPAFSKFTPTYWAKKIFRDSYTYRGQRQEVLEFSARISHDGRRVQVKLGTNTAKDAAARAAKLFERIKAIGLDAALAEFKPDSAPANGVPTIGRFFEAVRQAADISPRTLKNDIASFRWIVIHALGIHDSAQKYDYKTGGREKWLARIDRIRMDRLSPVRIQNTLNAYIAKAKADGPLAEQRARISAASFLRQAKGLYSRDLKITLENVPKVFEGVRVKVGNPKRYVSTVNPGQLLRDAKAELAEKDPEALKVILLALGAGLRKAEIDSLQWQQVDSAKNVIRVMSSETFETKTAGSQAEVFVDAGLIAELEAFRPKATGLFVLESARPAKMGKAVQYYRANQTFERITAWLRSKGVLANKPIHTLRKEFGSLICQSADIYTASRQLRHSTIATTSAYYLDARKRVAPAIGDMLNPKPELQPQTTPQSQPSTKVA